MSEISHSVTHLLTRTPSVFLVFVVDLSFQDLDEHRLETGSWATLTHVKKKYYSMSKTAYKILTVIEKKLETLTVKSQFILHFIK